MYFVVWGQFQFFDNQVLSTVLKIVPVYLLVAFVFLAGFKFTEEFRYHKLILIGLVCSSIGDSLLDWLHFKDGFLFPFGMLAFAVAQIFYIAALGWKPLRLFVSIFFYAFGIFSEFKFFFHLLLFK